jgi:two-component system, sensor histidine kinase
MIDESMVMSQKDEVAPAKVPAHGIEAPRAPGPEAGALVPLDNTRKLFATIDEELEMLRRRSGELLSGSPTAQVPIKDMERLEALVLDLREANANLTLASLDASTRESAAVDSHQRQTLFLAMLAHELRNPLAPIVTSADLLGRMEGTSPEVQALQGIIKRQSSHLSRLVDDLLDISRINSNKFRVCKQAMLLNPCLDQAVETCQPELMAHKQGLRLSLAIDGVWVYGDPTRLTQLFSNLILNASKFSPEGSPIYLSAQQEGQQVRVSVRDEGIGISPDKQPYVFDLFTQGAVGQGMMAKGLGLGLTLVRTIAELHEGSVSLKSRGEGLGSEFVVTLPVMAPPAENAPATADLRSPAAPGPAVQGSKHILLIDDHPDINQTLGMLLRAEGHHVDSAVDGPSGLRMEQLAHYDVVCCDIGLPGMSGYEVATNLRARPSKARLIAISGYDQQEQKDRAAAAGFDHYLVKPILGDELLALIAHD